MGRSTAHSQPEGFPDQSRRVGCSLRPIRDTRVADLHYPQAAARDEDLAPPLPVVLLHKLSYGPVHAQLLTDILARLPPKTKNHSRTKPVDHGPVKGPAEVSQSVRCRPQVRLARRANEDQVAGRHQTGIHAKGLKHMEHAWLHPVHARRPTFPTLVAIRGPVRGSILGNPLRVCPYCLLVMGTWIATGVHAEDVELGRRRESTTP
jgi:hypothetical protein